MVYAISTVCLLIFASPGYAEKGSDRAARPRIQNATVTGSERIPQDSQTQQTRPVFRVEQNHLRQLTITDTTNDRVLISPNNMRLWVPHGTYAYAQRPPIITAETVDNGVDLHFDFRNHTASPLGLGIIQLGGIRFDSRITDWDFSLMGRPVTRTHQDRNWFGRGNLWPGRVYSPVTVLQDDGYTIGFSLQYDMVKYQHASQIQLSSPGGRYTAGGRNWALTYRLNPHDSFSEEGLLQPGESRRYTVSIRIIRDREGHWLETLLPYRDFFRQTYGPVQYTRDPRPINAITFANDSAMGPNNRRAMTYRNRRIDEHGWGPWVNEFNRQRDQLGIERFLIIAPSGLFYHNRHNNFPFMITSPWQNWSKAVDSEHIVRQFAESHGGVSLWWGRSARIMTAWDTPEDTLFDVQNPDHVRQAIRELDGAARIGTDTIGLDAFTALPQWDGYRWLKDMHGLYPNMKFVTETMSSDVLHTIAATYVWAVRPSAAQANQEVRTPIILADFINPGHETWAQVATGRAATRYGIRDDVQLQRKVKTIIRDVLEAGLVPVIHGHIGSFDGLVAGESWLQTIPSDLQVTAHADE